MLFVFMMLSFLVLRFDHHHVECRLVVHCGEILVEDGPPSGDIGDANGMIVIGATRATGIAVGSDDEYGIGVAVAERMSNRRVITRDIGRGATALGAMNEGG